MSKTNKSCLTPAFRVSYPSVFQAKENELSGKMEYSVVALFPKGCDLSALKACAKAAIEEKWGADQSKWPKNMKTPFRDQAEREKVGDDGKTYLPQGHEAGAIFINLKSYERPGLVDQKLNDIVDKSEFYAGCWARAKVTAYAYDTKGNKGVAFGLSNLQKVKDDDSLTGRTKPQDDFAPIETGEGESSSDASATSLF